MGQITILYDKSIKRKNDHYKFLAAINGIDLDKNGTETTNTTMILPGIYAGVESQIKSWLTGRFGLAQTYRSETVKTKPAQGNETEDTEHFKDFALTFGLGFNFGRFTLDAFVNEGLFFDGPNFISGTNEPLASKFYGELIISNFRELLKNEEPV